jgi:TolA-binding protein
MPVMESLATINSVVRTIVAVVVLGAVGAGGWLGYTTIKAGGLEAAQRQQELEDARAELESQTQRLAELDRQVGRQREELAHKDERIEQLDQEIARQEEQIERLDTSLRLLKVDHRVARIDVLEQGRDSESGEQFSRIEFVEVDDRGEPVDEPREFTITGDVVYVDYWIAKFEESYVEAADLDRSTSLVLFRRIFGEYQEPTDGFQLDEVGTRPTVYAQGTAISDFEQKIWDDFWSLANDPARASELGVRAAHGEAVSMSLRPGRRYKLMLRASDGLSITPDGMIPTEPTG